MKLYIKKGLLWLVVVLIALVMGITLVDCTVFQQDVTTDALLNARDTIRQSNISIETVYYKDSAYQVQASISGRGSGVVFKGTDTDYYALTNYHVITDTYKNTTYYPIYEVTDINGNVYNATLEMGSKTDDIAILSFKRQKDSVLTPINYTKRLMDNVNLGELVLAVGNPSGVNNVVTYGKILGRARISNVSYIVINHNALINPGNIAGSLLGLNTWGTDGSDDDNFAIPLSVIDSYINTFIAEKLPDEDTAKVNIPDEDDKGVTTEPDPVQEIPTDDDTTGNVNGSEHSHTNNSNGTSGGSGNGGDGNGDGDNDVDEKITDDGNVEESKENTDDDIKDVDYAVPIPV
jgi:S1-C subfamily serine protease